MEADFERNVFVNCPFDERYLPLLRPLLFTVAFLGFQPRIASDSLDSLELRIDKICRLIRGARYSVHDLSRLKSARGGELSRMNMPFELGVDYGCRLFGGELLASKRCLILEKDPHEFRKALSDLAGIDISSHDDDPSHVVRGVRNWLCGAAGLDGVEGPTGIWYLFNDFTLDFYDQRKAAGFSDDDLDMMPVAEYITAIIDWLGQRGE